MSCLTAFSTSLAIREAPPDILKCQGCLSMERCGSHQARSQLPAGATADQGCGLCSVYPRACRAHAV
eukprot:12976657-Alexandrium_andersonii.AAC.1